MVIFLYSDKNCEYQAISCIKSFESKITDDLKILYFTIGFESNYECKNLYKKQIYYLNYPSFHFYKAELSIKALEYFPEEEHFIFTDTDVLFSKRFLPKKLQHNYSYPLAIFGPHEYPFIFEQINGERVIFDEVKLMQYFNVSERSMMYQWSCFYVFNRKCLDFLEEYTSICKNKYLVKRKNVFFPFQDETAFNICLWKRKATKSLGYLMVNTHQWDTVKMVEESNIKELHPQKHLDALGADWEYIDDSSKVILYHGFKEKKDIDNSLNYLISKK